MITNEEHEMAENKIPNENAVPPGCTPAGPGAISAWVAGVPAPQGSKRGYARRGQGGKLHVSLVESSDRVKPWREDIRAAFLERAARQPLGSFVRFNHGGVVVKIVFVLPRPKATPKTRPTPAAVKKPDLDKLVRAVLDALTSAGVYADDSQVVTVHAHKRIAELGEAPGATIHVEPVQALTEPLSGSCTARVAVGAGLTARCVLPAQHRSAPHIASDGRAWWDSSHAVSTIDTLDSGTVQS